MTKRSKALTHKKAILLLLSQEKLAGYLNPNDLGRSQTVDVLTSQGEHRPVNLEDIKSVYFVRDFAQTFALERKIFLSRPKLDGLWVRLRFVDEDVLEGIVANDLLDLLDYGVRLTPPDIHGNTLRMFIPRTALLELKVLGVVGIARRVPKQPTAVPVEKQTSLFDE